MRLAMRREYGDARKSVASDFLKERTVCLGFLESRIKLSTVQTPCKAFPFTENYGTFFTESL